MTTVHRIEFTNPYTHAEASMRFTLEDGERMTNRRVQQLEYLLEHWQVGYAIQKPLWVKTWALGGQRAIRSADQ